MHSKNPHYPLTLKDSIAALLTWLAAKLGIAPQKSK